MMLSLSDDSLCFLFLTARSARGAKYAEVKFLFLSAESAERNKIHLKINYSFTIPFAISAAGDELIHVIRNYA